MNFRVTNFSIWFLELFAPHISTHKHYILKVISNKLNNKDKNKNKNAYNTCCSRVVPHPSTRQAQARLTSEF